MIELYVPTGVTPTSKRQLSPRLETLDGKVMGILNNGKWNAGQLLTGIQTLLTNSYDIREVIRWKKESYSSPAERDMRDEIAQKCDFVITAIGD